MEAQRRRLCFVAGEPAIYEINSKKYTILHYDYNNILDSVISRIIKEDFKKRPRFIEILGILCKVFEVERYNPNYNISDSKSFESFESKFYKDITSFFDKKFPRFLTEEEKSKKELVKQKMKEDREWNYYKLSCLKKS